MLQHLLIFVSSLHLLSPCSLIHVPSLRVWTLPHTPQVWTLLHTSYSSLTQLRAGPHFLWLTLWLTLLCSTSFSHLYPVQYIRACTVDSALSLSSSISRPKRLSYCAYTQLPKPSTWNHCQAAWISTSLSITITGNLVCDPCSLSITTLGTIGA